MPDETDLTTVLYQSVQETRPLLRSITAAVDAGLNGTGISVGMRAVLECLANNGRMTIPELSRALSLKRQFVQKMIREAEAGGLVARSPNPAHKTAHFHDLTTSGKKAIYDIRHEETGKLRRFLADNSRDDIIAHARIQSALTRFFNELTQSKEEERS